MSEFRVRLGPKFLSSGSSGLRVRNGPYLRWMEKVKEKLGPRKWQFLLGLRGEMANAFLLANGVVPYKDSVEALDNLVNLYATGFPDVEVSEDP